MEFLSQLKPLDVIALLVLLADIDQDKDGMEWAYGLLERGGYPYVKSLSNLVARQRGGRGSGASRNHSTRNAQIREAAEKLLSAGRTQARACASPLAAELGRRTTIDRQIRQILNSEEKNGREVSSRPSSPIASSLTQRMED